MCTISRLKMGSGHTYFIKNIKFTFSNEGSCSGNGGKSLPTKSPSTVFDSVFPLALERERDCSSNDNPGNPQSLVGLDES